MGRVDAEDAAEILGVIALYAQIIDNRDWNRLDRVFTPDLVFGTGPTAAAGYAHLAAQIEAVSPYHPHYSTDTVLHRVPDGRVKGWTKFFLVRADGTAGSGDYIDEFVRTPDGWRLRTREFSRGNRAPSDPGGASVRTFSTEKWRAA